MSSSDSSINLDKILPLSSLSSDSESLFEIDVKNNDSQIDHEWDVIERTLYQEPGPHVTDPELLRECKLWRDTFPHFRVTGTKIDVKKTNILEIDQSIQTVNNHFDITKLDEKRQSIKKKVVGELVERLIAKFSLHKETESEKSTVQITEIHDDDLEDDSLKMKIRSLPEAKVYKEFKPNVKGAAIRTEGESYFERGKPKTKEVSADVGLTKEQDERGLFEIFNCQDKGRDFKGYKILPKLSEDNGGKAGCIEKHDFDRFAKQPVGRSKPKTNAIPSDSVTSMFKPFKMVSKIDKKYEGLLGKIMERTCNEPDRLKYCRTSSSGTQMKSCQDSLEKLRIESGFNYRKNLPKINKFNNNWLDRGEMNAYQAMEDTPLGRTNRIKSKKLSKELDLFGEERTEIDIDDFIENVKKEMVSNYKRQPRKSGGLEGIRSKPFKPDMKADRSVKSWSCGDLPKRGKKEAKSRQMKNGFEKSNELNFKSRSKLTNLGSSRGGKVSGSKNTLLPPIESA